MKTSHQEAQKAGIGLITAFNLHFSGEHDDSEQMINHAILVNHSKLLCYPSKNASLPMSEETGKLLVADEVRAAQYVAGCAFALSQYAINRGVMRMTAQDVMFAHQDVDQPEGLIKTQDLSDVETATFAAQNSARAYIQYFVDIGLYESDEIRGIRDSIIGIED